MSPIIANILIVLLLLAIIGGIVLYLYRAKKRGEVCIGCPYAKQCAGSHGGGCGGHGAHAQPPSDQPSDGNAEQ